MGTHLRVLGESYPLDIIPNLQALNGFGKYFASKYCG